MRILHYYNPNDPMVSQHVKMLTEGMDPEAESHQATESEQAKTLLQGGQYNILHLHGCWRNSSRTIVSLALRQGARLVVTPHGQLEPWVKEENYWREKLPKTLLYQRDILRKAYAVVIQGRMEQECMNQLEWNPRTVVIRNAVVTSSITPKEMARQTFLLYRKILDSNTLELMDEPTARMLKAIIKIGIMGDRRWTVVLPSEDVNWRHLFLYAEHEHIRNYVDYGINILGLTVPNIDTTRIAAYFPDNYETPRPIREKVGDYKGKETDYLLRIIHQIRQKPLLLHLIELTRELYRDTVDDDQLAEGLAEKKLTAFTRSLMQVLDEQTALDEGYMPLPPADNRLTQQIRRQLENHLNIED